jgi:hypothetical protein
MMFAINLIGDKTPISQISSALLRWQ